MKDAVAPKPMDPCLREDDYVGATGEDVQTVPHAIGALNTPPWYQASGGCRASTAPA